MTNGEGMVTGSSRHHRDGSLGMGTSSSSNECAGCGKRITDRFLLKALDLFWHEDCLKCGCCDCRLGEVGSTLYTKANLILCKRDYLRLGIMFLFPVWTKKINKYTGWSLLWWLFGILLNKNGSCIVLS